MPSQVQVEQYYSAYDMGTFIPYDEAWTPVTVPVLLRVPTDWCHHLVHPQSHDEVLTAIVRLVETLPPGVRSQSAAPMTHHLLWD
jgi:hypothetical protein